MQIQFNTDSFISGNDELTERLSEILRNSLSKYEGKITRLEVHLSDEDGNKRGQKDKRCMLEARLENIKPIAVTSYDNSIDQAVSGAIPKLMSAIDSTLGKMGKY